MIDFVGSKMITDKDQFYREQDLSSKPEGGGSYPPHELDGAQTISPVPWSCFIHDNTITVNVTFKNPLSYSISGSWSFDTATFVRLSNDQHQQYTLSRSQADTTITIPGLGSVTKTAYINGLPGCVCYGDITVAFSATCEIGGNGSYEGIMYLVDGSPAGYMGNAWTEVLEAACVFADGKYGKSDCLKYCTKGLYNCSFFQYNDGGAAVHIVDDANRSDDGYFKLSGLFSGEDGILADCRDVSAFLSLCTSALGHEASLTQVYVPPGTTNYKFRTSSIKPMDWTSYAPTDWFFHQFLEDSGSVYDACAAQQKDLSGNDYYDVPVAWPRNDYWQKQNGNSFLRLVNGLTNNHPLWLDPTSAASFVSAKVHGPAGRNVTLLQGIE